MQSSLGVGDHIVTIGGLHGTVVSIDDDVASLEIAPGVTVQFARQAIARTVAKAETEEADEEPVEEEHVVEESVDDTVTDTRKKD